MVLILSVFTKSLLTRAAAFKIKDESDEDADNQTRSLSAFIRVGYSISQEKTNEKRFELCQIRRCFTLIIPFYDTKNM